MKQRDNGAVVGTIVLSVLTCGAAATAVISFLRAEQLAGATETAIKRYQESLAKIESFQKSLDHLSDRLGQPGIDNPELLCRLVDEDLARRGPEMSYPLLFERMRLRIESERKRGDLLEQEALAQKKRADNSGPNFSARLAEMEAAIKRKEKEVLDERHRSHEMLSKLEEQVKSLQEELASTKDIRRQEQRDHEVAMGEKSDKIRSLTAQLRNMKEIQNADNPAPNRMQTSQHVAKVVAVDFATKLVTLDAGPSSGIRQGMRLKIFRPDNFGKPSEQVATLEVARLETNRCMARIMSNDVTVPILSGDLAFNALASSGRPEMVALIGELDEDGDGQDDTQRIERFIIKQGGQVLCRMSKDGTMRGKITSRLTYVVMDMPEVADHVPAEHSRRIIEQLSAIRKEALEFGIPIVSSRKFLQEIGYKLDLRASRP